jgi:hypothetical protein
MAWLRSRMALARRVGRSVWLQLSRVRPRKLPGAPDEVGPSVRTSGARAARAPGRDEPIDVVAYFPDPPDNLYQLRQWLPILGRVAERHRVGVVCRSPASFVTLVEESPVPVILVRYLRDLDALYESRDVKVCLYVNNHHLNFQSLTFPDPLHVHLNHGESDKVSMASHQARAYDRVVVAGQAAIDRYRANLLEPDAAHLLEVGRPQIDLLPPHRPRSDGRVQVVYAPTWEGGRDLMDYSSVATMGEGIVRALLAEDLAVIYRPHPKLGARSEAATAAHRSILRLMDRAVRQTDPGLRRISEEEPLGDVLACADVLITDVSSVAMDFLPTGRPLILTRPVTDGQETATSSEVVEAGMPLPPEGIADLAGLIRRTVEEDPRRAARETLANRYFGDTSPGASTERFLVAIDGIVAERERLVAAKRSRTPG